MKSLFLSVLSKIGLFLLSTVLGMLGYLIFQGGLVSGSLTGDANARPHLTLPQETMDFNAEPVLLAKTLSPVDISADGFGNTYVLQKNGKIVRIAPETREDHSTTNVYAELANQAVTPDLGFTALAFHPEYLVDGAAGYGKFYVVTTEVAGSGKADFTPEFGGDTEDHQDVLYEFTVEDPLANTFNGQKREVMRMSQPGPDHNLSSLAFDQFGCLYLGVGDGAAEEVGRKSASKNASSLTNAYGKVLRIDPLGFNSTNGQYGIPETNPFRIVSDSLPEIWAFGLRAPHSLAYDPFQRRLCIGEIGLDGVEKIHLSQAGGEHFGWDLEVANSLLDIAFRSQLADLVTEPLLTIDSKSGPLGPAAGNLVYRGESFPSLSGRVIVASLTGQLMATSPYADSENQISLLESTGLAAHQVKALRSNSHGELMVICGDGGIYELRKRTALGEGRKKSRRLYCSLSASFFAGS